MRAQCPNYLKCLAFFLMATLSVGGCSKSPTEDIIQKNIEAIETHIEKKQTGDSLALFHDNFNSSKGYDKNWVKRTLLLHQMRHQNIEIVISNVEVIVKDEYTAYANLHALATGGQGLLPTQGAIYKVETEWRNEDGDWLLVHSQWEKSLAR